MADQSPITKIYRLETIGYQKIHSEFSQLSVDLTKIKKILLELKGQSLGAGNAKEQQEINKKIVEAAAVYENLEKKLASLNNEKRINLELTKKEIAFLKTSGNENAKAATTSYGAYYKLTQAYKEARNSAQELAAEHGVESIAAKEAAAAAEAYKNQLLEINRLVKSGGQTATVPVAIPFTTNLAELEAERESIKSTGDVVSDLNKEEAAAAISATEFGKAHKISGEEIKESAESVSQVQTKYEEFTGSLRQNIVAQLENSTSLKANKASQKEIETAIGASGQATQGQINRMAALKEQEQLLIETNKGLTVTIRNQAKEFIAAAGSLDESQAQLNQLQQSYESLSEIEKTSPFGRTLKKEIDTLEPAVKSLEAELGKFSRNVGNYPKLFGGAFKVLEKELDVVQGKLVSGDFSGKEFDDLTAKQEVLTNATKTLGTTFSSSTQQAAAYKEAGRQIALVFGTNSDVFKNFSAQVAAGNQSLKQTDKELIKATGTGNKFTGVLSSIYGGFRKLANIIPGLGIGGLLLLLLTPLKAIAAEFKGFGSSAKDAANDLEDLKKQTEETAKAVEESSSEFVKAVSSVESLKINIKLAKDGLIDKKEVLKQYNETLGKTIGETDNLQAAEELLISKGDAYIQMTLLKAAANIALESAAKKAFEAEQARQKDAEKFLTAGDKFISFGAGNVSAPGFVPGLQQKATETQIAFEKEQSEKRKKAAIKNAEDEKNGLINIAKKFQKDAAEIAKDFDFNFFDPTSKKDKKTGKESDELKRIDAELARLIAIENTRANEIEKVRDLTFDEEVFHLKRIEMINLAALDKKIEFFQKKKNLDAEELKSLEELREKKSAIELQTSQKINAIEKKKFDTTEKELNNQLALELKKIDENKNAVLENVNLSEVEKAQAQLDADLAELAARENFYNALLALNDNYNKNAAQKAKEGIEAVTRITKKDQDKISLATLQDIKEKGEIEIRAEEIKFGIQRKAILDNQKLTAKQKQKQLEQLESAQKRTILSKELDIMLLELEAKKFLLALSLLSDEEYQKAYAAFVKKAEELSKTISDDDTKTKEKLKKRFADLKSFIQEGIRDLFKLDKGSEENQALGDIVAQSYDLAMQSMNNFFDAEQERIRETLAVQLERLDIEKQQVIARAQSQAEIDSIEKQFAEKKKAEERKAHEQLKKSKKSELKIALAVELANVWSSVMRLGPIAGLIAGAVLSGLAIGRYALRVSEINKEKFAFGGKPGEVPVTGGKFGGKPHSKGGTDFHFKGKKYNAEVDELAVIRTKSAPKSRKFKVEGTQMEIASAINKIGGGIDFKPGAKVLKMFESGGFIGQSLQAPVFTPISTTIVNNKGDKMMREAFEDLSKAVKENTDETKKRIDKIQVTLVTSQVTKSQTKQANEMQVGTL